MSGGPGGELLPGAQDGCFPFATFPAEVKFCSLRTAVRPYPEGVPASDVPRASPRVSGGQSMGRLSPSIRHSSAPRVTGPSLRTVWMSSCALCRPPEAASCSRRAGWVSCGSRRSPLLHPDSCSGAWRGLHSGALSAPGDPRIRGSSSPGLRRRAMDVPGSEHEPPSGHRSVPGREGLPLGTQAGTLLTAPGLLGP